MNVAALFHCHALKHCGHKRRILCRIVSAAKLIHIRRALEKSLYIDSGYGRRQKPHRAKLAESAANSVRNEEGFETFGFCDFDEVAAVCGGGGDDVFGPVGAEFFLQDIGDNDSSFRTSSPIW